ncbi:hypothetical protein F4819DRAFT_485666 [Hypoxylon fuscum]|nr:hypothetical protein F4819DRAFT_485666 [Hypoxylon fuscum]
MSLCMVHHGGPDFQLVVPMAGKPRMGTASFSRSTSPTLPSDPCLCLQPPSSASVTEWYNALVFLFSGGVVGPGGPRVPTIIRVTRPQSMEPAKLIGICKRISGSTIDQFAMQLRVVAAERTTATI